MRRGVIVPGKGEVLYTGPELQLAAERSALQPPFRVRVKGIRNAAAILSDVARNRLRRREAAPVELVLTRGVDPESGVAVSVAYAGPGDNREWCLATVFPEHVVTDRIPASGPRDVRGLLAEVRTSVDIVFTEGIAGEIAGGPGAPCTFMPAWVKQRVRVLDDWPAQVDALRRVTRQETGRFLRKYGFGCSLTRRPEDFEKFYDRMYKPYVGGKFGAAAYVVDRHRFLKECGRGALLQLTRENEVLGAALLRPTGSTMSVVWSALDPRKEAARLRGVTDTLDYFSLLYAHLCRCRWLDLGPSRPDLFDGTLRYKAKWGAEISAGRVPQALIGWRCLGSGALSFLRRHAFLVEALGGLRAVAFIDGDCDPSVLQATLKRVRNPGVGDYRIVLLSRPSAPLHEVVKSLPGVTLVEATSYADIARAVHASG